MSLSRLVLSLADNKQLLGLRVGAQTGERIIPISPITRMGTAGEGGGAIVG